ncbi:MAG: FAD-binding oxidoreductase, partial [Pseudomonadota bacterium]
MKTIVGRGAWKADADDLEPHLTEWRGVHRGRTLLAVFPASTEEVSACVRACHDAGVAIVPQGGNTGMCAGAVPDASGDQVILCLSRMNTIRSVDPQDFSLVAEAGCILADLQKAAKDQQRYFPLSLGGEGSCQIGGNLSTNAGGINVIRYGTTRDLVLGVEVVLADGTIWNGLKTLRKDTAGYDLKQLFIGGEGTLGIVTAVAVKLFPDPGQTTTAFVSLPTAESAVTLLGMLRRELKDSIQAFELIGATAYDLVLEHIPDTRSPFDTPSDWYVLLDVAIGASSEALEQALQCALQG